MEPYLQNNREIHYERKGLLLRFFRLFTIKAKPQAESMEHLGEEDELIQSIRDAKNEWIDANMNFEYAGDKEIVDYYTYKIKACQVRYEYFIKKAKEKGIKVTGLENEIKAYAVSEAAN